METNILDVEEKTFTRNLGYPMYLKNINGGDPFKNDRNGFTRNSIAHNAYRIRMNIEHDPKDSFRAALDAVQSQSYYERFVDLFACPICELCFVNPKRFLIHFKWHTFGLEIRNLRNKEIASLNSDLLVKEIMYNCYCSEIFPSMNELDDHVKKRHGFIKSSSDFSTCKNGIDPHTQINNSLNLRTHSKTENILIPQEGDVEYTSLSSALKKTEAREETQSDPNKVQEIKINRQSKIRLINADEPEMAEIILKITEKQKCDRLERDRIYNRKVRQNETEEQRYTRLEKLRKYRRELKQNETEEQRCARLERKRISRQNETEEQRCARLEWLRNYKKENKTKWKQNETEEQRSARLERKRIRKRVAQLNETEEQKCARLERDRIRKRNGTEEQRCARLERDRIRRQNETEEQRRARLERNRIRYKMKQKNRGVLV